MLQKKALEEQLQEFTRTLAQRDELIAQLRAGREVRFRTQVQNLETFLALLT